MKHYPQLEYQESLVEQVFFGKQIQIQAVSKRYKSLSIKYTEITIILMKLRIATYII